MTLHVNFLDILLLKTTPFVHSYYGIINYKYNL